MAVSDPTDFTANLIADMRAHGGVPSEGYFAGRKLLILTTIGARSGEPRTVVLAYRKEGDAWVIAGTKGGAPTHPAWVANLEANPNVTIEVGNEVFAAKATIKASGEARDLLWDAHVDEMPGFGEYPAKTDRVFPMILLERAG
jgi:deazaflavin-dependent oxidoreductase (nitroreductase family)